MHKDYFFPPRKEKTRRQRIIDNITDGMADLFYYDRKEDEDLPRGAIEEAVHLGEITAEEMIKIWSDELRKALKPK